ncbi:Stf0 family sulfotransferase [Ekhidna sp.]|uniref:Stf0 family sulfotransferase n=1 Tax=Ekhidna sp. TaxID=2608089 RepID=UPI00329A0D6F
MNSNSKKIILLSGPRTGSNLMTSLLASHKDIYMYNELFNLSILNQEQLYDIAQNSTSYLKNKLSRSDFKFVGFKLFYEHLKLNHFDIKWNREQILKNKKISTRLSTYIKLVSNDSLVTKLNKSLEETIKYISTNKSFYIIHLKRENKLDSLLSLKNAFITDEWIRDGDNKVQYKPIILTVEECDRYFNEMENHENYFDDLFKSHKLLNIVYEDLNKNRSSTLKKITSFLGLEFEEMKTYLSKQKNQPNSILISNYNELKNEFKGMEWGKYFV